MPSTWTPNLGLEKPATGEQAGTWGITANKSYDFLDKGIDGSIVITLSASAYDLRTDPGEESIGRNKVIRFIGNILADNTINITPNNAQKIYFVTNHTSGGFSLIFRQGSGDTFTLRPNRSAVIYADGIAGAPNVWGALADFQVNSLLVLTNLIVNGQIQWGGASAVFDKPATFQALATFQAGATIAAPLKINLGGDLPYDLHYRGPTGEQARLGIGAPGQALTATASGPAWATITAAINMTIAGAAANQIFFANNSQQMVQDANLRFVPGTGLGLGMAPQRALSVGQGLPAVIQLDAITSGARGLLITTSNVPRWSLETSVDGELGGNTGSNCLLRTTNDAGATITNFASYRTGRSVFGSVSGIDSDTYGAQLAVQNQIAAQSVLVVRGAVSQLGMLQRWQNSAGTTVASMDGNGVLTVGGLIGGPAIPPAGLSLDAQKRLEIGVPVATGHPLGTLHIGPHTAGNGAECSIALEPTTSLAGTALPAGVGRLYFYNGKFVIEYSSGGNRWYTYIPLVAIPGNAPAWLVNTNPVFV